MSQPDAAIRANDVEILTDAQIEDLLQQAEERLRQKSGLAVTEAHRGSLTTYKPIPKLRHDLERSLYMKDGGGILKADRQRSTIQQQQEASTILRPVETTQQTKTINDVTDAGAQWFNLPKTELSAQLKRDLQMIDMRNVLDPHRHYKKNTRKGKIPTFSQVGTVIEGPTEFFSGRINKKERSKNFVEEAMKSEADNGRFKRKYAEIQDKKTSGKKAHYKKLMARRKKS